MFKCLSKQNIAAFYLILMCVQILYIEGWGTSPVKVAAMMIAPFILLFKVPVLSKALVFGILYWLICFVCALFTSENFRVDTVLYLGLFILMYSMFYNLIYKGAFTIDFAIRLLKGLILAYGICQIGQQLFILAGIRNFPLLNLVSQHYLSVFKVGSLSWEPSSSARVQTVCFYALLKLTEYKCGYALKLKQLFRLYKWVTILFLYSMLTMGSGTAIVGLAVLSLYLIKRQYSMIIVPLFFIIYISIPYIDFEPLNRAYATVNAVVTLDSEEVQNADGSAAARITPMLNTINNLDLTKSETWFGKGTDVARKYKQSDGFNSSRVAIGEITDYGFIAYLLATLLVFSCSIEFFSLATIMYFIGIGGGTANISYQWGLLMVFTVVRYFHNLNKLRCK